MKKINLIIILVICMLFFLSGCNKETEGLSYYILNDRECAVGIGENHLLQEVVIPSKHDKYVVTTIMESGFRGCENLRKIIIPNSVTSIGDGAFSNCYNLTNITIPNSVTSIGTYVATLSALIINLIAASGIAVGIVLLVAGAGLLLLSIKRGKLGLKILAILCGVLGLLGLLQALGILSNVPIFQFGIPAVLSIYFDVFSGFVQALVFSLLSMVYIASACPAPEEA